MTITTAEILDLCPAELKEQTAALPDSPESGPLKYYGLQGEPISMRTWATIFEAFELRQLVKTEIGPYFVSTIWLGLDHSFGHGRPLIFESMVFERELSYSEPTESFTIGRTEFPPFPGFHFHKDFDQRRYATQEEALAGHEALVNEISLLVAANPEWRIEGDGYAPMDTD